MTDYGFAAEIFADGTLGWALTPDGQIRRATSAADRMMRLLRPFFGAVALEPYRGAPGRAVLKKRVDAAPVICQDRARLLLKPMTDAGEITGLAVTARVEPGAPEFIRLDIRALDAGKRPVTLSEFVRIP